MLISMTNLTSAGQLAGIGIIHAGGGLAEMALTQLVINLRYALMSLSLSQKLDGGFNLFHRLAVSFGITDEIFAVASSKKGDVSPRYMYGLIMIPYIGWAAGTALGTLAGNLLPEMLRNALGIALYGMFIAIVVPPAKKRPKLLAVIGIAVGLSCLIRFVPVFSFISDGFSIIICTLIAATAGALLFPVVTEDADDE
ncbi:MAG: AzlC family ABC transporter permease [Candidatus Flemingiibacterium sp.]